MSQRLLLASCIPALLALPLHASGTSHFDAYTEGVIGTTFNDGGVIYSNLDTGLGPPPAPFIAEDASADLASFSSFTTPNCLGFTGWSPGTGAAFGRCMSFEMTTGGTETNVEFDLYVPPFSGGDSMIVDAYAGATIAGSLTLPFPNVNVITQHHVQLGGFAFDRVVVHVGPGSPNGALFILVDNVVMNDTTPGAAFCAGDGIDPAVTTPCPCSNFGSAGHGCANSVNAAGAELVATGATASDSVVLEASGMPGTVSCIYLQGDADDDAVFGDGVRCAGGTLIRLRTRTNVGGASEFPDSSDTITLSQRGGVTIGSGAVRRYQTYYRNAAPLFCPPETFNVTNGWRITW